MTKQLRALLFVATTVIGCGDDSNPSGTAGTGGGKDAAVGASGMLDGSTRDARDAASADDSGVNKDAAVGDGCPNDSKKTAPGVCGCGKRDTDTDSDGTADCFDECDLDPHKDTTVGYCGCGVADTDTDSDGTADCLDKCPTDPDKHKSGGRCGCGVAETDTDSDGVPDCADACPTGDAGLGTADAGGPMGCTIPCMSVIDCPPGATTCNLIFGNPGVCEF
jgi:hypothetical protein